MTKDSTRIIIEVNKTASHQLAGQRLRLSKAAVVFKSKQTPFIIGIIPMTYRRRAMQQRNLRRMHRPARKAWASSYPTLMLE